MYLDLHEWAKGFNHIEVAISTIDSFISSRSNPKDLAKRETCQTDQKQSKVSQNFNL